MLTLDTLESMGVDTREGLERCMGKEDFYFRMLSLALASEQFERLEAALAADDKAAAFDAAHALKGVTGNLSLTPLYGPISDLTERLRAREEADYLPLYRPVKAMRDRLLALSKT